MTPRPDVQDLGTRFVRAFGGLAAIGRNPDGAGWTRCAWTDEDAAARRWFAEAARGAGMRVEGDRNGNLWAWWGTPAPGAIVTGSHLDTVPGGGAYDGALGLVSGILAVEELQHRAVAPRRPIAVVAFADEEGARFNTPTFGSGLLTGHLRADSIRGRADEDGVLLGDAATAAGIDAGALGPDPERLRLVGAFIELHIEQGRGLADLDRPIALCSGIWPHGRWRLTVDGEANHAGTTRLGDRRDPMLVLAEAVTQARRQAQAVDGVATVGRVRVAPNASNAIAERVDVWLDARAPDGGRLDGLVDGWKRAAHATAVEHGCRATLVPESRSAAVQFDAGLRERLSRTLAHGSDPLPELPTAAGHDAGVLADHVPAAMLLVRNPTGVSHSCDERAETDDCVAGVRALADILETLACG